MRTACMLERFVYYEEQNRVCAVSLVVRERENRRENDIKCFPFM